MYVIQLHNPTGSAISVGSGTDAISIGPGTFASFPADRCVWFTRPQDGNRGYEIHYADFLPGNASRYTLTDATDQAGIEISLGYVGKSGRFVGITDPHTIV